MNKNTIASIAEVNPPLPKYVDNEETVSFITMADVSENGRVLRTSSKFFKEIKNGFIRFAENDVLFAKITPCMENGKGALVQNLQNGIGCGSTEFHVLRAKNNNSTLFIYQVTRDSNFRVKAEMKMTGSAGQRRVPASFFYEHLIYIPSPSNQRKIARILTTVDNIIEKTETAIEKYKDIKQGMMHDLFTRGIDVKTGKLRPCYEDAPELYKEAELGLIPIGWDVVELEYAADEKQYSFTGGPFGSDLQTKDYTISGVRIIQLQNIGDGEFLNDYKIFTSKEKANQLHSCNIFPGDIIISKMAHPVARACIIPNYHKRYLMASDGIRLKLKPSFNSKFIMEQINSFSFRRKAIALSTGTTRERIGLTELRKIQIKAPKTEEQHQIGSKLMTIDNIIIKEFSFLKKLYKQKQGLMQDLLTGKKEVAPDPEDMETKDN